MFIAPQPRHRKRLLRSLLPPTCVALLSLLSACSGASNADVAAAPAHTLSVTATAPHPLTFYESQDEIEPFSPFIAQSSLNGTLNAIGFAQREGAFYMMTYAAKTLEPVGVSNGIAADDPLWNCDVAPDTEVTLAPDAKLVARSCASGGVTIFSLPNTLTVFHQTGVVGAVTLTARVPVVAFAPTGDVLALTDDGPNGPGQAITLLDTQTWQPRGKITVTNGLLSRPSWSPDGTRLAALDTSGTLHIWDAASATEVATATMPQFTIGATASDPASPAPQWSADGSHLLVTSAAKTNTILSVWSVAGGDFALSAGATATLAIVPDKAIPQLAPDGSSVFVHTAIGHGQIFSMPNLTQVADFTLPGTMTIWAGDSKHLESFTNQPAIVTLNVGG